MKRIIKLRGELAFFAIISVIVSLVITGLLRDSYIMNSKNKNARIQYVNTRYIDYLEEQLKNTDLTNKNAYEIISEPHYSGVDIYIVKKDGDVIASSKKEVKKIDDEKIQDGRRDISVYRSNYALSLVTGCDYLKDGYFLYFVYCGYTNSTLPTGIITFLLVIITFSLLSFGRINYIITIKRSINVITQGDFSYRVPLKYKNELRDLAEDINYMASELQKEDEKRKEFLTNISHDLRTPLTSVLGYLNMINEKKYEDEDELESYINKINKKSLFLKSMLDDLFQYSKLASGDVKIQNEVIYLQELLRQLIDEEKPEFQNHNLNLSLSLQQEPLNINGDGEMLVRAVNNLLSNALKYSKRNTTVNVVLSEKQEGNELYAVISVNNVPEEPIREEEIKSFFERLYKKDKSRNGLGSGLGLSIVKEIVRAHHGFVKGYMENGKICFDLFFIVISQ